MAAVQLDDDTSDLTITYAQGLTFACAILVFEFYVTVNVFNFYVIICYHTINLFICIFDKRQAVAEIIPVVFNQMIAFVQSAEVERFADRFYDNTEFLQ